MRKILSIVLVFIFILAMPMTAYAAEPSTPTGIPLSEIESRIDGLVARYMHEFTPGLAVAVVHDGEIVFSRGYGYADITRQIPVDPATTVFEHGSISKLFVYVAVMQLVEQGLLDLDADIHNYLPEDLASQFNFRYSFTMRDLLNHSAGFAEFSFNVIQNAELDVNRMSLSEGLLATQPRQSNQPDTAQAYSNFGAALAALVVSYVSGLEFADFERLNILEPLGMTNTRNQPHWFGDGVFTHSMARGYMPDGDGGFNQVSWWYSSIYPMGLLRGTAEDLAQLAIALMPPPNESSLLFNNRDTLDLMLSPSYSNPSVLKGTNHGFLTYDGIYPGIGHSGGTRGFRTNFVAVPSQRFGIVILTNTGDGWGIGEKILDLLLGNSRNIAAPFVENLPNATSVEGRFVSHARHVGNILESLDNDFSHIQIIAIDENTITFNRGRDVITYSQVEPYVFRAISANTPNALAVTRNMYELQFFMENGQPVRISTSGVHEFTIETFRQSTLASSITIALDVISILYFLIISMILLIKFLRSKEKKFYRFSLLSNGLLLCGILFMINATVLLVRLSAIEFLTTAMVTSHIWINYILLALSVMLLITSVVYWKKDDVTVKRRVLFFSNVTILALYVTNLWYWNYFVMM